LASVWGCLGLQQGPRKHPGGVKGRNLLEAEGFQAFNPFTICKEMLNLPNVYQYYMFANIAVPDAKVAPTHNAVGKCFANIRLETFCLYAE